MQTKIKKRAVKTPEVIYRNNKPVSVIIDIAEYQEMLERLEEVHKLLGGKFAKKFDRYGNNDPFLVANYYNEWIFGLGLFSLLEKRVIQTYLDETEAYEIESKNTDHNDELEEVDYSTWKDFRGRLYPASEGRAKIILSNSFHEVKSHVGRWTRILIER